MTQDFVRVIEAEDPAVAAAAVQVLAKLDGHRVRTVKRVDLIRSGDLPEWRVTLAVEGEP